MQFLGPSGIDLKSIDLSRAIIASASLDFPSTVADATSTRTITVTGAAEGDFLFMGLPDSAMPAAGGVYSWWISAADTVTVQFWNNTGSSINPASGTFTAMVIKAS
jgi:hypothetical protein